MQPILILPLEDRVKIRRLVVNALTRTAIGDQRKWRS